ncbi:MAG: PmoA family protein [Pirellula sp.]|nr:PmoA family protein [Pirellula sp.]
MHPFPCFRLVYSPLALFLLCFTTVGSSWAQFSLEEHTDRIDVLHDGQLLTSYRFRSGSKPVLWPILGPDQQKMTRSYPLDDTVEREEHDHPHHRGLWMTFGEVDDWDWWAEGKGRGVVAHRRVVDKGASSSDAFIVAEHEWLSPMKDSQEPTTILKETCCYTFRIEGGEHVIDCEYVLKSPTAGKQVHFGDTKEGMFAIRVPESMRADRPAGEMLSSSGDRGGDVWGKSARWVDYSGPTVPGGKDLYGIAMLVHPESFRSQGLWHARTYGLFAHNPFGIKDFLPNRTQTESGRQDPPHSGGYTLPANESLHFMYRVILHRDRWSMETGNQRWNEFAKLKPRLH